MPQYDAHNVQTEANSIAVTRSGSFAVSGSATDASIAVFSLAGKLAAKKRTRKAKGHIELQHPALSLACTELPAASNEGTSSAFLLLAVTCALTLEVWDCRLHGPDVACTRRCKAQTCLLYTSPSPRD